MAGQDPVDDALHANGGSASAAHNNNSHHHDQPQPIPRSQVKLPLAPLTLVSCRRRHDGEVYAARIIEKRLIDGDNEFEYYVHYRNYNRRMDEWVPLANLDLDTVVPPELKAPDDPKANKNKKRRVEEDEHSEEEGEGHELLSAKQHRLHLEYTRVKNVEVIELGRYEMETWYFSPLPDEYAGVKKLYFCEYDLAFFKRREEMVGHARKCKLQHPPGMEIYRNEGISMFEVDGATEKAYCQNICYLAKLFLDHKSLNYDVDEFLFYVMCEYDDRGYHVVGYFSKEKGPDEQCNLACILTLPAYQRKGYGKFLIAFSYELSKKEGRVGTPERPLSDLGARSYRGFWARVLLGILSKREEPVTIEELSDMTKFAPSDITSTLQQINLIQSVKGQPVICAAPHVVEALLKKCGSPGTQVDPDKIIWTPLVLATRQL